VTGEFFQIDSDNDQRIKNRKSFAASLPSKIKIQHSYILHHLNDSGLQDNTNLLHLCTFPFFI